MKSNKTSIENLDIFRRDKHNVSITFTKNNKTKCLNISCSIPNFFDQEFVMRWLFEPMDIDDVKD